MGDAKDGAVPRLHVSAYTGQHVLQQLQRLARDGLDVATFLSEAGTALARAVPSGTDTLPTPSWATLDPTSLLITCTYSEGCEMPIEEVVALEYGSEMLSNRVGDVVRNPRGVQTAGELVESDPGGASAYLDLLRSLGVEHEALVALRTRDGESWGAMYLVRGPGRPDFSRQELAYLREAAPHLAEGIRRGLLLGEASDPEGPDTPAIVVLGEDLTPDSFTPGAQQWLQDLPTLAHDDLPAALLSVAQAALAGRGDDPCEEPPSARVLSPRRGWVMLHGQVLAGSGGQRVAVTIQPAGPHRITPLLMAAHGLTAREEQVTRHVLQGNSTAQIAEALCLSPYTVQEHLKNIFDKTAVRSRRELVSRVFTRHYQPRVEDNDERVRQDRALRGGPFPHSSTQRIGAVHREPV
jgi:DNA-binding CsgD family transcriptional regulator/GAF domain-containing protein